VADAVHMHSGNEGNLSGLVIDETPGYDDRIIDGSPSSFRRSTFLTTFFLDISILCLDVLPSVERNRRCRLLVGSILAKGT
jgi:hypothetical protein